MSTLSDPALTFAALQALVAWLSTARVRPGRQACTHRSELVQLAALSVQDLYRLSRFRPAVAGIEIDPKALRWRLEMLEDRQRLARQRDQFICKGASTVLMQRIFDLDKRTTRRLRRLHQIQVGEGRPRLPPKPVRDAIQARWRSLSHRDLPERYLMLSARFRKWSLDALHQVVSEIDEEVAKAATEPSTKVTDARRHLSSARRSDGSGQPGRRK